MTIYTKDANRTASAIARRIDACGCGFTEKVSDAAYKWLDWNAGSLAHRTENLLDNKYYITITREIEYGEKCIHVEWRWINEGC